MTETAAAVPDGARRPTPIHRRLGSVARWAVLVGALVLAGPAAAAPVTVGIGVGADLPGVPVASELTIDRGDPLGVVLTVPVLVGHFRAEPQLAWSGADREYGMPPAGHDGCSRSLVGCSSTGFETGRTAASLTIGPAWSVGERGRLWAGPWGGLTWRLASGSQRDWSLGASVGGELLAPDGFSFGFDLRVGYTSVTSGGSLTRTYVPTNGGFTADIYNQFDRGWTVEVDGLLALRYYLN
jgi:hypothetical protein